MSRATLPSFATMLLLAALVPGHALPRSAGRSSIKATGQCAVRGQDLDAAVHRFSRILQFETVSDRDMPHHLTKPDQMRGLHDFLATSYPAVWRSLTVEQVGEDGLSLLLTWPGTQPELQPLLFISHLDVVPVAAETLDQWQYPPFSGAVAEGCIWGRGALDVKIGVAGLLEAVSLLLAEGWQPTRTVMLGFGQDEEVGGDLGAGITAALLQSRGITELDAVLDEGSTVFVEGFAPYTRQPVALVATAEKGYYSVKVRVPGRGGHSSIPPIDHSSAGAAAGKLLTALDAQPPPGALVAPVTELLQALAPAVELPWLRTLFSQPERPDYAARILGHHLLVDSPLTAALARTTAAVTGIQAYVGDNVLPPTATININFRLLPGDTVDGVMAYLQGLVDSLGLNATFLPVRPDAQPHESEATPVTPSTGRHFAAVRQTFQELWPTADGTPITVAPFMLTGGTDSKHYLPMSRGGVLRFVPTSMNFTDGDVGRVHGINERLRISDLGRAICVYRRVMELLASE